MKRFFQYFVFAISFILGSAFVFYVAAVFFHLDVFGFFVLSASKVVGVFGDHFPLLETRYGKLQIRSRSGAQGQILEIACTECRLEHKHLATNPFTTSNAHVEGTLKNKRFTGDVHVEDVTVHIDAVWENNNVTGSFELPRTEIRALYHAIRTIVPEADKADISGTVSGTGKFSWPQFYFFFEPKIEGFEVKGLIDQQKYKHGKFIYQAEDSEGQPISVESGEGTASWVPLDQLGQWLRAAVVAVEDRGFYQHKGYDLRSMLDATTFNKRRGEIKRGGSTLTQQLSKNLFLTDERTYARKLRELLYAVEIDRELGKKRVMELYLNIVELGPNIFGAYAGAKTYFHKAPGALYPEEAAWLANILRSPKRAYKFQFLKNQPQTGTVALTLEHMSGLSDEEREAALARGIVFAKP